MSNCVLHVETKEFLEINLEHELLPTITNPTRITKTSATLINNIIDLIGRNYQSIYTPMIILTDLSDHYPTLLEISNLDIYKKQPMKIKTRKLDHNNVVRINDKLETIDWDSLLNDVDTESSCNTYQRTISSTLDEISPVKEYTINPNKAIKEK